MNKQELIKQRLAKPFEVGDVVSIVIPYTATSYSRGKKGHIATKEASLTFKATGRVLSVNNGRCEIEMRNSLKIPHQIREMLNSGYGDTHLIPFEYLTQGYGDIGADPFAKEDIHIQFYQTTMDGLLSKAGYWLSGGELTVSEQKWAACNFDPYVINAKGEKQFYQRGSVWTLEQKQMLIDSIYNNIEIGKFLFRRNAWKRMEQDEAETGKMHSFDCVDGKQRMLAIISFIKGEFPDSYGNYWTDLSAAAWSKFKGFGRFAVGDMSERTTDKDVIQSFLTLNFTGVPMSKEHIEYVKSIQAGL